MLDLRSSTTDAIVENLYTHRLYIKEVCYENLPAMVCAGTLDVGGTQQALTTPTSCSHLAIRTVQLTCAFPSSLPSYAVHPCWVIDVPGSVSTLDRPLWIYLSFLTGLCWTCYSHWTPSPVSRIGPLTRDIQFSKCCLALCRAGHAVTRGC